MLSMTTKTSYMCSLDMNLIPYCPSHSIILRITETDTVFVFYFFHCWVASTIHGG